MTLSKFDQNWRPVFVPLHCSICNSIVRGCLFIKVGEGLVNSICEACYRTYHQGQDSYLKSYKHCILTRAITPAVSRNVCLCSNVPHFDSSGRPRSLFPINLEPKHLDIDGMGGMQCGLLKLPELVALAKYNGMQTLLGKRRGPDNVKQQFKDKRHSIKIMQKRNAKKEEFHLKKVTGASLIDTKKRTAASGETIEFEEAEADKDIPFFFRKYTEKYPFGNVHMALRVGPLLVENGVAQ